MTILTDSIAARAGAPMRTPSFLTSRTAERGETALFPRSEGAEPSISAATTARAKASDPRLPMPGSSAAVEALLTTPIPAPVAVEVEVAPPPPPAPVGAQGPQARADAHPRAEAIAPLARALEELRTLSETLGDLARNDAIELGIMLARQIVGADVPTSREPLVAVAREAMLRFREAREITVRVNPDDAEMLSMASEAMRAVTQEGSPITSQASTQGPHSKQGSALEEIAPNGLVQMRIVPDATLKRGDVVVDTEIGSVDARRSSRLEALERAAREAAGTPP